MRFRNFSCLFLIAPALIAASETLSPEQAMGGPENLRIVLNAEIVSFEKVDVPPATQISSFQNGQAKFETVTRNSWKWDMGLSTERGPIAVPSSIAARIKKLLGTADVIPDTKLGVGYLPTHRFTLKEDGHILEIIVLRITGDFEVYRDGVRIGGHGGDNRIVEALEALFKRPGEAPVTDLGVIAPKPLFRDPVYDGAADPIVVWNRDNRKWWMFYTNRRANVAGLSGVAWVHGTPIGIAESADGATWKPIGNAEINLPPEFGGKDVTQWAPEIVTAPDGIYHLFLTVVPGIFENWQHPRTITHLTSTDLRKWKYLSALTLASDRVIDPVVHRLPDGSWRMWYNNERDNKSIWFADSPDLNTWTDKGRCAGVAGRCEGPFVFDWKGHTWMIVDTWKGLGVYRSDDQLNWSGQPALLLDVPGKGADDGVNGSHPGVVVNGGRAFLFYFTHPGRGGTIKPEDKPAIETRRSSIQVVELVEKDGVLTCNRDAPTHITLRAPGN